jgi:hypothetical protein
MLAGRKFSKTKIALATAIIVSTAASASAATKHRAIPRHRPGVYALPRHRPAIYPPRPAIPNVVAGYNNTPTPADPNAPSMTGGGSLGYNQMLLID